MASTVLAAIAATMLLTSMRISWKSPFLSPALGAMMSTKMLPTEEPVWLATLRPLSCSTLLMLRSLRVTICAVLPTCSICAIAMRPPLSWPMMNDCAA